LLRGFTKLKIDIGRAYWRDEKLDISGDVEIFKIQHPLRTICISGMHLYGV
jgi:hypothetical protein